MTLGYSKTAFDAGSGLLYPDDTIMDTGRVPSPVYYDADRYSAEREIFRRTWLNLAEEAELPNPGDWVVRDVRMLSSSVIIVRGKDGVVRAFHNICAHRGMKLVWDDSGRGGKFSCPYHAWMFDSLGDLVNIPDEGCFPHVDREKSGLTPISCDTWGGFVYVNLDDDPAQSLVEFLGPAAEALQGAPFEAFPTSARISSTINANWKLALEAQTEGYHAAMLHGKTVGKMLVTKDNPFNRPLSWEPLGAHRSQSIQFNPEFAMQPHRPVQIFALMNGTQIQFGAEGDGATMATLPGVNKSKSNNWGNEQFALYPNHVLHVSTGGWFYHRFWPLSEKTTVWEAVYHFGKVRSLRESFANQCMLAFNRDTLTEDNVAIEMQQEQLPSGARSHVQFGEKCEMLCRHFAAVNDALLTSYAQQAEAAE